MSSPTILTAARLDSRRLAALLAVCALAFVGLTLTASSARASFPGVNGQIAFTRCVDGLDCDVAEIWTMNPDGTGQARLFGDPGHFDDDPSFSADGRTLAFQRCVSVSDVLNCGIATIDARGQGLKQLTPMVGPIGDDYPSFSRDGSKIAFSRYDAASQTQGIWVMNADGSNPSRLTKGGGTSSHRPEFSPDGTKIVFERGHTLVLINADGSNEHLVTSTPTRKDDDPSFSPDGSQITFTGCTVGGTCDIWVAGANGASPHRITTSPTDDREPTFSPDGKRVVFERWQPDMTTRLFAQALAGGNPTQVSNGYDWAPTWRRVPTPSIDTSPAIAGTPRAGHVLTVAAGHTSWGGTTRFQWLRCSANCTAIPGATAATYRATNADIGAKLVARQIQSSEGGSVHADSHALGPVAPEPGASIARKVTITRTGRLLAFLSCPAAQSGVCRGTLTFAVAAGKRAHHTLRAGSAPISILSGKSATASVRLSKQAKKLLTGSHRPHLKAKLVTSDDAGNTTKKTSSVALTRRGH